MSTVEFLSPRLRGERFNDGSIPLEFLADFSVLREMVVEVARWSYMEANPGRRRSPRGFAESTTLKLTRIDTGSAIPVITLSSDQEVLQGVSLPYQEFFEEAREHILDAIASAESDELPVGGNHLPARFLAYFSRIGQGLQDNESLEFPSPRRDKPAKLTKDSRQRLLQRSSLATFRQEVTLRGTVPEADQSRMTFELQAINGTKVAAQIPEQHFQTIVDAFSGYQEGVRILVQGVGRYDRQGRISGLESISHVRLLDALDVPARLDEFRNMQDGWLEGKGVAPAHTELDWLADIFERNFPDDLPLPNVFPSPEGGIEAEWSLGSQSVIFEIDLNNHRGDWLQFDKQQPDDESSLAVNLDNDSDWEWMSSEIRRAADAAK